MRKAIKQMIKVNMTFSIGYKKSIELMNRIRKGLISINRIIGIFLLNINVVVFSILFMNDKL